jgi:ParB family chromosome partitioning protein
MTKAVQKITLSPSRDIPFNKLVLGQSNVRRVKAGVSIEQLAESIAQRTLLQGLSVRAVVDADGNETGMFEVPAGGRRYRALELLVKQKRMSKTQAVPCVVREGGIAEDDSVAENDERVGLPDTPRSRHERGRHCRASFREPCNRQAAPAPGVGLAKAA